MGRYWQTSWVSCPKCGKGPGYKCETASGQKRTVPHIARQKAAEKKFA